MKKLNSNLRDVQEDLHSDSLVVIYNHEFVSCPKEVKLAIFDLDHTLIKPKAYRPFPMNSNDWIYAFANVKQKLESLQKKNYLIFIVSN